MFSVSEFIRSETEDSYFTGTRMMVVEWDGVAKLSGNSVSKAICYNLHTLLRLKSMATPLLLFWKSLRTKCHPMLNIICLKGSMNKI